LRVLILQLAWLQVKYLFRSITRPKLGRYFWRSLAYEARSADRTVVPSFCYALPIRDLESVFPGLERLPISLIDFRREYGGISFREAQLLTASIRQLQPRTLFEFGTFHGATTIQLAANAPSDATVHTIDLPDDHPLRGDTRTVDVSPVKVGQCFRDSTWENRIRQHYGDTTQFDFSEFEGKCDWIFVDAAHTYECASSDTQNALRMIRPGGVIFWHDCVLAFPGVCRVLEELARTRPVFRVAETSLGCLIVPRDGVGTAI
jgi:predicted O-methyltransferase YrrM